MKRIVLTLAAVFLFATIAYASMTCPADGMSMYFTGSTKVVSGRLLKEYKCPQGHTGWGN